MRKLLPVLFCFLNVVAFCQFNIKIGYNAQYAFLNKTNSLFQYYNANQTDIGQKFNKFHFMHGLEIGARYMITNSLGLEANFINIFSTDNKSSRIVSGNVANDEWRISNRLISLGFENVYTNFGYGMHLGYSNWKYLKDFPGGDKKQAVFNENILNLKLNLSIHVESGSSAFALKPYYNYPLTNQQINSVDFTLNKRVSNILEKFNSFGLAIVFYNGPQSR